MRIYISETTSDLGAAVAKSLSSPAANETIFVTDHLNGEYDSVIELSGTAQSLIECTNLADESKGRNINLVLIADSEASFARALAIMTNFPWPETTRVNIFRYDESEPEGLNHLCQFVWWHLFSAQQGGEFSHQIYFEDGCETEFDRSAPAILAAWKGVKSRLGL